MINVLMCGSVLSVKGGMVSVVKNYLNYKDWEDVDIRYIPTHINANKYVLVLYFMWAYIKVSSINSIYPLVSDSRTL